MRLSIRSIDVLGSLELGDEFSTELLSWRYGFILGDRDGQPNLPRIARRYAGVASS